MKNITDTITDTAVLEMVELCGYQKLKSFSEIQAALKNMENEGYKLFDYAVAVISDFWKMRFGPQNRIYSNGKFQYKILSHLSNIFVIDPSINELKGEIDRFQEISEIISDSLIPLGIYSGNFLAVGESKKIYTIVPSINSYVYLLGRDFTDFLSRYYLNLQPIFEWKL